MIQKMNSNLNDLQIEIIRKVISLIRKNLNSFYLIREQLFIIERTINENR